MGSTKELLIIEDDPEVVGFLTELLQLNGYAIRASYHGTHALHEFEQRPADLILLDLALPDISGFDVLERIRRRSNVPVVILSGDTWEADKVRALEGGADDYITKPFHEEELLARISALLRRVSWSPQGETTIEVGQLRVDMARRQVSLRGDLLHLTPIEYAILCTLMQRAGEVVSHEDLLTSVWGHSYEGDFSVLRVNISRLRQKIEERPRRPHYIQTVPSKGYRIPVQNTGAC